MTVDEPRVRVTTNLALGICLILLGTVLILDRLRLVPASQLLRFWPIGLVLFGVAMVIQSFQRGDASDGTATRQDFNAGARVRLGDLSRSCCRRGSRRGVTTRTDSSETASVVAVMGRHQQISSAPVFRGGEVTDHHGTRESGPAQDDRRARRRRP